MLEKIISWLNRIAQKAWFGNFFFHGISDLLYNIACFGYKLVCIPTKEHRREVSVESGIAKSEKEIKKISRQMWQAWFIYGILPQEYIGFHFETRNRKDKKSFVSNVDGAKYCTILNDLTYYHIFRYKYEMYQTYKPWYKREVIRATDIDKEFINRHPTFMFKPESGHKGVACKVICASDYPDLSAIKASAPNWNQGICEEMIKQGPWAASFHPSSVNTCRIQTLVGRDGKVRILGGFFRMGRGNSFVDNAFTGGLLADIDVKTGVIDSAGFDERGHAFFSHPESHVVIKGNQIPQWKDLCKTIRRLAKITPEIRIVGWDMVLTDQGWVMIEGNPFGAFAQQYATGKGIKNKLLTCMRL